VAGRWFSSGPPGSSTNKTDHHDITEILLKVVLSTIKPNYCTKLNFLDKRQIVISLRILAIFVTVLPPYKCTTNITLRQSF